ncbi:hypothetical protein [Oceanicola sp. 502str15]|uniref:hypothetical protein n=1 Tax=Oceanicola sp. 502str15 TaxID=2696061 RepID=UPI002095AFBD|nr:hypothetical protein [Oceanicola sp. 502str15]MCO6382860.1 hypothetical protein [Oceanicola sp. 502str15]
MQLTSDILDRFRTGRFEEFLDDGSAQLQSRFPKRFAPFSDPDEAHDAGRNIVGLSYERASELGRRSGLLAMRIAFLRTAWGIGVLDDPRHEPARQMVNAQVMAPAIKDMTAIGTFLSESRDRWEADPLARGRAGRIALCARLNAAGLDWDDLFAHLQAAHDGAGTGVDGETLRSFVQQAYSDAMTLGFSTVEGVQLHVLAADLFGIHFWDDPLLPHWGALYRSDREQKVVHALRSALVAKEA